MPPTTPVHVRVEIGPLAKLEEIGRSAKPKALNRSEMINVAIAEYVQRHEDEGDTEPANGRRGRRSGAARAAQ